MGETPKDGRAANHRASLVHDLMGDGTNGKCRNHTFGFSSFSRSPSPPADGNDNTLPLVLLTPRLGDKKKKEKLFGDRW